MAGTIDSLDTAARNLHEALEQYVTVCSTVPGCFTYADRVSGGGRLLSERVINELGSFNSYASRLNKAKSMLAQGRNSCATVVPINGLPDEVLAQIFRNALLLPPYPRAKLSFLVENFTFPRYPDLLLRVCSHWRRVAVNSRTIWSHIDLAPSHPSGPRLMARANMFAGRAGPNPLFIRVFYPNQPLLNFSVHRLKYGQFFSAFGTHIQSLEFVAEKSTLDGWEDDGGLLDEIEEGDKILEACLQGCRPGVLDRIAIVAQTSPESRYLEPGQRQLSWRNIPTDVSHVSLENHWASIKILWLDSLYPPWTSKAYQDLVELHLVSEHEWNFPTSITEAQLIRILKSSPALRILQLKLVVEPPAPGDPPATPVQLNELEILSLSLKYRVQSVSFLRWIVVGPLPLQLSLERVSEEAEFLSDSGFQSFFERSWITSLRLRALTKSQEINQTLNRLPHLRVLVLEDCFFRHSRGLEVPRLGLDEQNGPTIQNNLHRVYLLGTNGRIEDFGWLKGRPIQTLVLRGSGFTYHRSDDRNPQNAFSNILPATNIVIPAADFSTDYWEEMIF